MTSQTAALISQRFLEECSYIDRFVGLLGLASLDIYSLLYRVTHTLQEFGFLDKRTIGKSPWRAPRDGTQFSMAHLEALGSAIQKQQPKVQALVHQHLEELRKRKSQLPPNAGTLWRGAEALINDCIEYLSSFVPETAEYSFLSNLKSPLLKQLKQRDGGPDVYDNSTVAEMMEEIVNLAIQETWITLARRQLEAAEELERSLDTLDLTIRFLRPDAEVHIWRQGFINLMTVFEASIFDITRIAFHKAFFHTLSGFTTNRARGEKLSLQEFSDYGSYEAFQNSTIDAQLRGVYLKELLFILRSLDAGGVATPADPHFAKLIELVLRRNVHIHNRGRVDEEYLGKDRQGTEQFNLFGLRSGDLAIIDESYYWDAVSICSLCVNLLAQWADQLGSKSG